MAAITDQRLPPVMQPQTIQWNDFEKVMLCAGTVLRVEPFPEARKPAWKLWVDFGPHGVRKTSAQVKAIYSADELVGRQIVGVINFPPRQVGPFVPRIPADRVPHR